MTRRRLIVLPLLLLCLSPAVFSQDKLGHLKSWDGKTTQELDSKGKVTADFFLLPEVRTPLKRMLTPADFTLVTKTYSLGSPFKLMGNFLATTMCRPHNCGDDRAGLAINLSTGDMYVRIKAGARDRWIPAGKASALPQEVQDLIKEF
jgi:hypothetical protein